MISKLGSKALALAIICSAAFTLTLAPASARTTPRPMERMRAVPAASPVVADRYVYVSDANNQKIYVYPINIANPAPLNIIDVAGTPTGMAVAANGNLYVVVSGVQSGQDNVFIYTPGGASFVGSIGYANGIASIRDVAFDSRNNLYVSCLRVMDNRIGVMKFAAGSTRAMQWYPSPTEQTYGILLGAQDDLFISLGLYGTAIEYAATTISNSYLTVGVGGAPTAGGLAFSGRDLIMTGGTGLFIFTPSPPQSRYRFTRTSYINYGVGHATGYLTRSADGTLYVPVFGDSGGHSTVHEVRIYRENHDSPQQYTVYSTITKDLQYPSGVAVGP